ncbi:HNH endonuclease [Burkholderia sp. BCC0044]|uniref:HNH endonuclease n=1 Tax=Burkholderia sp. BCC0044 TaxID=2676295 RepID=UPI001589C195|nr:HNH endonuclease [Burkholderia sp. BCC0044]
MKKIEYTGKVAKFVQKYDGINHEIWNSTEKEIQEVRKEIREHYLGEQSYRCAYCRIEKKEKHGMVWDVEHILPKSLYPKFVFEPENLCLACKECNTPKDDCDVLNGEAAKRSAFPNKSGDYRIVHPHYDIYSDHFEVSVVGGRRRYRILNKGKARFTYMVCDLSRFDYKYAEWENFDNAIFTEISVFLDRCPKDSTPDEIKRMLGHLTFVTAANF